jgi:uncharacterized protein
MCAAPIGIYALALLVRVAAGGGVDSPQGDGAALPPVLVAAIRAFAGGSYVDVLEGNLIFTAAGWLRRIITLFVVRMFAMFLLGVWAHRAGIFREPERHRGLLRRVCLWAFVLGAPASAVAAWLGDPGVQIVPDLRGLVSTILLSVGSTGLCLFYASGLTLLFQRPRWRERLLVLTPVGSSALSNYLLQSVMAIAIFYGIGFGWYNRVSLIVAVLIACAMFAVQIVASRLWMARAYYGPAEWLWRQFTYRQRYRLWKAA